MNNKMYFSPSRIAFYQTSWRDEYEKAGTWPIDAVEIEPDIFETFSANPPHGYLLGVNNGMPAFIELPPPSDEELKLSAELRKAQQRYAADAEIAWRQDAADEGIATDEEAAELLEWRKFRVLLMRVDTAKPEWPTPPVEQAS